MKTGIRNIIVVAALCMMSVVAAWGQIYTVQTGNWNDPETWGGEDNMPTKDDDVILDHNVTIPIGCDAKAKSIAYKGKYANRQATYKTLTINGNLTVTELNIGIYTKFICTGSLFLKGSVQQAPSAKITTNEATITFCGTSKQTMWALTDSETDITLANEIVINNASNVDLSSVSTNTLRFINGNLICGNIEVSKIENKLGTSFIEKGDVGVTGTTESVTIPFGSVGDNKYVTVKANSIEDYIAVSIPDENSITWTASPIFNLHKYCWSVTMASGTWKMSLNIPEKFVDDQNTFENYSAVYTKVGNSDWKILDDMNFDGTTMSTEFNFSGTHFANEQEEYDPYYCTFGVRNTLLKNGDATATNAEFVKTITGSGDIWTGAKSNSWGESGNWLKGVVPDSDSDVKLNNTYTTSQNVNLKIDYSDGTSVYAFGAEGRNVGDDTPITVTKWPTVNRGTTATCKSLNMDTDASLTINYGSLNVIGAITVPEAKVDVADLITINNSHQRSSALKFGSTNYNKFTINRTFDTNHAYYIGSATVEGTINEDLSDDYLSSFNSATGKYTKNTSGTMQSGLLGSGINFNPSKGDEATITQIGQVYYGNQNIDLAYSATNAKNLICNPYLFPIKLNESAGVMTLGSGIWPAIIFRTYDSGEGKYVYKTYSYKTEVSVSSEASLENYAGSEACIAAPQQGFFLIAESAEDNGVSFNVESYDPSGKSSTGLKSSSVTDNVLRLVVCSTEYTNCDETAIIFDENGSLGKGASDAAKYLGTNKSDKAMNAIYCNKNNAMLSINNTPIADQMVSTPMWLTVKMGTNESTGIILPLDIDEFDNNYNVVLHDAVENTSTNLRTSEYEFAASEAGATIENRFYITLEKVGSESGSATSIDEVVNNIRVMNTADGIKVKMDMTETGSNVKVYDIAGHLVASKAIESETSVSLGNTKGLYIVEVSTPTTNKTVKINKR